MIVYHSILCRKAGGNHYPTSAKLRDTTTAPIAVCPSLVSIIHFLTEGVSGSPSCQFSEKSSSSRPMIV